ncbi:MAG: ribonuclease P protein component [Crocinitomicaceae bacterium]
MPIFDPVKKQRLSKKELISEKQVINRLFEEKNTLKKYPLLIYFGINSEPFHRIVVSVPKRNFKKAVDRNRIKRQLREIWRKNREEIKNNNGHCFDLFIIYTGKEELEYQKLESKFILLLKEIK